MRLDHMDARGQKTRAENLYEKRGFTIDMRAHPLLVATSLALTIQRELVAAQVFPDYVNAGRKIRDTTFGDVLEWIANGEKDADDYAVLDSIVLTQEQKDLLDDYADQVYPLAKGVTASSVSKFKGRYMTAAQKREAADAARAAKDEGEDTDEGVSKGVSITVCDTCDEFAYVPNGFASKNCSLTRGCEGTLMRPPKCERVWTTKKREAARKREEKARAEAQE